MSNGSTSIINRVFNALFPQPEPVSLEGDELWRIEFFVPQEPAHRQQKWINNMSRAEAFALYADWKDQTGWIINCPDCPRGRTAGITCTHGPGGTPAGWDLTEVSKMRIMPMREAI